MPHDYLNPPGLFHHPNYTRVLTVEKPSKLIYIAGQTPADDNYQPLHPGDLRAQYAAVLDGLTLQLKAAGATWDDVVFRRMYALDVPAFQKVLNDRTLPMPWDVNRPSPSTLIGVTALANPGFSSRSRSWRWWRRNGAKAGDEIRLAGSPALMRDPWHPLPRGARGSAVPAGNRA
jgi:enamine deaminase RidA (YjgF/YER057c/UK114 family)